jgi:hypothetical protein
MIALDFCALYLLPNQRSKISLIVRVESGDKHYLAIHRMEPNCNIVVKIESESAPSPETIELTLTVIGEVTRSNFHLHHPGTPTITSACHGHKWTMNLCTRQKIGMRGDEIFYQQVLSVETCVQVSFTTRVEYETVIEQNTMMVNPRRTRITDNLQATASICSFDAIYAWCIIEDKSILDRLQTEWPAEWRYCVWMWLWYL